MKNCLKKLLWLVIPLLVIGGFLSLGLLNNNLFEVIAVVDGDTIKAKSLNPLKTKDKILEVRYIGVDAPEPGKGDQQDECYVNETKEINKNLVLGRKVRLEFDKNNMDRFGRYLAYVYVKEKSDKEMMINKVLLEMGAARFFLDTVNIKYQKDLITAATKAHENKIGLWQACAEDPKIGCVIKGNVDRLDKRWYHLPHFRHYNQIVINLEKGDQWFCREEEAIKAGFKKARE